jgi:hypothetical protein
MNKQNNVLCPRATHCVVNKKKILFPSSFWGIFDFFFVFFNNLGIHCEVGTEKSGSQVPIHNINNLSLKVIVLLIGWITRSASLHRASRVHMHYAVHYLNAWIFDWSTTMVDCMKRQLTKCRIWEHRNFRFGTVLCSFFFDRVPNLSPRETI